MTTLLLVRHGESVGNLARLLAGHLDVSLTEKGLKQAELTAKYLAERYKVDEIYSSDLARAYQTALTLSSRIGVPVQRDRALREIDVGVRTGIKYDDYKRDFPSEYEIWQQDAGKMKFPNGESTVEMADRIWRKLKEIVDKNEGKTVAVFTHATPIKSVYCRLMGIELLEMQKSPWGDNASINVLGVEKGEYTLISWNVTEHMGELVTKIII